MHNLSWNNRLFLNRGNWVKLFRYQIKFRVGIEYKLVYFVIREDFVLKELLNILCILMSKFRFNIIICSFRQLLDPISIGTKKVSFTCFKLWNFIDQFEEKINQRLFLLDWHLFRCSKSVDIFNQHHYTRRWYSIFFYLILKALDIFTLF